MEGFFDVNKPVQLTLRCKANTIRLIRKRRLVDYLSSSNGKVGCTGAGTALLYLPSRRFVTSLRLA